MKNSKRLTASIVELLLGIGLIIAGTCGWIDEYWSGMGTALIFVAAIWLLRSIRYKTNADYREKVDVAVQDERNKFIALRAWAWAGYLFVIIGAAATIALKIMGHEDLMMVTSGSVCLIVLLYWVSNLVLRKKY